MNIESLLERLRERLQIQVAEIRQLPEERKTVYILVGKLPDFPSGRQNLWYALVVEDDQDFIDREEIEAIRRHFWHASTPLFDEEITAEAEHRAKPKNPAPARKKPN